jgi:hypothetical protein
VDWFELDLRGALGEALANGSYHWLLEASLGAKVVDRKAGTLYVLR